MSTQNRFPSPDGEGSIKKTHKENIMKTYTKETWKKGFSRLLLAVFLTHQTVGNALATPISIATNDVNLTVLALTQPSLISAALMKWRQPGVPNATPVAATGLSFAYFNSGSNLLPPNRTTVKDWTANDQNDLWSDNVLQVNFTKGNDLNSAIIIYTANHAPLTGTAFPLTESASSNDPLKSVALRGGLVGCVNGAAITAAAAPNASTNANPTCQNDTADPSDPGRQVVLPLIWKAVSVSALMAASTATVDGVHPLPFNTPLDMYTELTNGTCPVEFLNAGTGVRTSDGFCDFSTHFVVDLFNLDPANLFYSGYATTDNNRRLKFNYQSVVGRFGINATDNPNSGGGGGAIGPAYLLLGISAANAMPAHFGTTLYVESVTY
jgi:hypothetical protein